MIYQFGFFLTNTMFLLLLCLGTESMKDLLRAKTCFSHTHLSTKRSQLVLQTRSGSYRGLNQALRMCIYMKDCDQVLGHFGNTIQGQAGWKFQRDHLLDTLNAEGLGTDQCWSEVFTFQRAANSAWGHGERATLWKSPRLLVLGRSEKSS